VFFLISWPTDKDFALLQGQIDCGRRQLSFRIGARVEKKGTAEPFSVTRKSLYWIDLAGRRQTHLDAIGEDR
jgi:hypothetical protein